MLVLGYLKAAMASQLSVIEKKQLVEHKIALHEDGIAFTYKDQVAYCQENFGKSPSSIHGRECQRLWVRCGVHV
jgi:hypothetical protein